MNRFVNRIGIRYSNHLLDINFNTVSIDVWLLDKLQSQISPFSNHYSILLQKGFISWILNYEIYSRYSKRKNNQKKKRIEESKIDVINQNIFTFTSSWNNRLNTQIQSLRVFGVLTRGDQLNRIMNRQTEILFHEISRDIYKVSNVNINSVSEMSRTISLFLSRTSKNLRKIHERGWKYAKLRRASSKRKYFSLELTLNSAIKNFAFYSKLSKYKRRISRLNERLD